MMVTSTHHQIMRPNRDIGIVLMEAPRLTTFKECVVYEDITNLNDESDVEAVFYPDTKSLCYQPHPEYCDFNSDCMKTYKSFLRNYLELDVG